MSEALYGSGELESLVKEENVFDGVFECLRYIWGDPDAMSDRNLANAEYHTRLLERQLERFYPSLYDDLQNQLGNHPVKNLQSGCGVIMDGLSLREGFQLQQDLSEEHSNWKVSLSWAMIEQLPSDTKFACQAWFGRNGPSAVNQDNFRFIGSQEVPKLPGTDPEYVWTRFPDERLEGALKGNYTMEEIRDIYEDTKTLLTDIITESVHESFLVTSDHGYVNHLGNNPYTLDDDQRESLASKFSSRYGEVGNGQAYRLLENTNVLERIRNQYVIRGHYSQTKRGASKKIMHGGMSLPECMTPVLRVKTNPTGGN